MSNLEWGLKIVFEVLFEKTRYVAIDVEKLLKRNILLFAKRKKISISKNQRFLNYFRMEQPNYKHLLLNFLKSF